MFHEDAYVSSSEPKNGADNFRTSYDADIRKVGQGGAIREVDEGLAPETTALEQQLPRESEVPGLSIFDAEKYFWKRGKVKHYLSPKPQFMEYVKERAFKAAQFGFGLVYPGDGAATEESSLVGDARDEVHSLVVTLRAMHEQEAQAFVKYLHGRMTRAAAYAVITQFELANWARRSAARNQDASEHPNFAEKQSRKRTQELIAGQLFAVLSVVDLGVEVDLSDAAFAKAAQSIVYDAARWRTDQLLTPEQEAERAEAGATAATMTAEDY